MSIESKRFRLTQKKGNRTLFVLVDILTGEKSVQFHASWYAAKTWFETMLNTGVIV